MRRLLQITLCLLLLMSLAGAALAEQARMPEMPTPPPQCTAAADLVLYYNPEGGAHYHMDAHCPGVAGKYLPLSAHFLMAELGQAPYCELTPCRFCGAPAAPTAVPAASAIPVYVDGMLTEGYSRETPIDMPSGQDYNEHSFMVGTEQGDSFHTNAAVGSLESAPASLDPIWTTSASAPGDFGFLSSVQPVIIKWPMDIRESMNLTLEARDATALKEVILPDMEGHIHFLNLEDGSLTRPAIDIGYPIGSAVTLHPLGYPLLLAGQYNRETATVSGHTGLRYIDLSSGVTVRFVDGQAAIPAMIRQELWGGFNTSPLIDQNTNTAVFLSDDGWLFTEQLFIDQVMHAEWFRHFIFDRPQSVTAQVSAHYITADPVMYGSRLWLGNEAGQVICVDTTTMQPLWTAGGFRHVSALALEASGDEGQLRLWVTAGMSTPHLLALSPDTGEVLCEIPLNDDETRHCVASQPVIGQEGLSGLVFATISEYNGCSVIAAVDTEAQTCSWRMGHPNCSIVSAPVAVYDDHGNGYIVAAFSNALQSQTTLLLVEGRTGVILDTLTLEGCAPCDPAVYRDMLVITTKAETSLVHGIRLAPAKLSASADNAEAQITPTRPPLCTPVPLCTTTPLPDETQPEPRCWVEHRQVLENFLQAWKIGDRQTMLSLCSPAWAAASDNPERELFLLIANRTPLSWEIIRQTDANGYHMYSIHVELDRHDGREPQILAYWVYLVETEGTFYVDPLFLTAPVEASLKESLPAQTAAPVSAGSPDHWAEHTSRFIAFMSCWQSGDLDGMLARISPQWLASIPDAAQQLSAFIQTCPPGDYCIDYVEVIEAGQAVAYEFTILSGSDVAPVNGHLLLHWESGAWYVVPAEMP